MDPKALSEKRPTHRVVGIIANGTAYNLEPSNSAPISLLNELKDKDVVLLESLVLNHRSAGEPLLAQINFSLDLFLKGLIKSITLNGACSLQFNTYLINNYPSVVTSIVSKLKSLFEKLKKSNLNTNKDIQKLIRLSLACIDRMLLSNKQQDDYKSLTETDIKTISSLAEKISLVINNFFREIDFESASALNLILSLCKDFDATLENFTRETLLTFGNKWQKDILDKIREKGRDLSVTRWLDIYPEASLANIPEYQEYLRLQEISNAQSSILNSSAYFSDSDKKTYR